MLKHGWISLIGWASLGFGGFGLLWFGLTYPRTTISDALRAGLFLDAGIFLGCLWVFIHTLRWFIRWAGRHWRGEDEA